MKRKNYFNLYFDKVYRNAVVDVVRRYQDSDILPKTKKELEYEAMYQEYLSKQQN